MKKLVLTMALAFGVMLAVNAQEVKNTLQEQKSVITDTIKSDDFKPVNLDQVTPKVQEAVKVLAEKFDINALFVDEKKQLTKVEATDKADKSKKVFYFDAEGKEVKLQ